MALCFTFLFQFHFLIRKEKGKRNPYFSFKNPLLFQFFFTFLLLFSTFLSFFRGEKKKKISSSFPIPFLKRGKQKEKEMEKKEKEREEWEDKRNCPGDDKEKMRGHSSFWKSVFREKNTLIFALNPEKLPEFLSFSEKISEKIIFRGFLKIFRRIFRKFGIKSSFN